MQGNSVKETNKLCKETTYLPLFPDFSTNKVSSKIFPRFFATVFYQLIFFLHITLSIEVRGKIFFLFMVSRKLRSKFHPRICTIFFSTQFSRSQEFGKQVLADLIIATKYYILLLSIEAEVMRSFFFFIK